MDIEMFRYLAIKTPPGIGGAKLPGSFMVVVYGPE
jgi:hypothetical protein